MAREHAADDGLADTVAHLSEQTRDLVRREIKAARAESWQKLKQSAPGSALLAAGGLAGVFATAASYRMVMRMLDKELPPVASAAAGTAMFGGAAGAAILAGLRSLRDAPAPLPTETLTTTREAATASAGTSSR